MLLAGWLTNAWNHLGFLYMGSPPTRKPCFHSKHPIEDDHLLQLLNTCAFSLAKAIEVMDNSGLILAVDEAEAPHWRE